MATYKYQQNFATSSNGYVKYNITPDFGNYIAPGETVTVTGVVRCNISAMSYIFIKLSAGTDGSWTNGGKTLYEMNISIPKSKETAFSATFQMPTLPDSFGTSRVRYGYIEFEVLDAGYSGETIQLNSAQKVTYLSYRLAPTFNKTEFYRCMLTNSTYTENDEGTIVFGNISISLPDGLTSSAITSSSIRIEPSTGNATTYTSRLSSKLSTILSSSGYSEINTSTGTVTISASSALLNGYTFETKYSYKITFSVGDSYNTYQTSVDIGRSFANVHMSGAANGGICFGGFSTSTDDNPKFECYYPAYFYGGIQGSGGMQGGITDSVSIKQNYAEVTVTFPTAFDAGVTPVVMVCLDKAAQDSDRYIALLSAMVVNGSVTNTGFKVRLCSNSSNTYSVAARWLAFAV